MPDSLEEVAEYAFYGCIGLKEIQFPDSLKVIATHAFENCKGLSSVFVPLPVKFAGDKGGVGPFLDCRSDLKIYCEVAAPDPDWCPHWNYYGVDGRLDVTYGVTRKQYEEIIKQPNP